MQAKHFPDTSIFLNFGFGAPAILVPVWVFPSLVAHDCGYPLSRYTCRATRVAADSWIL